MINTKNVSIHRKNSPCLGSVIHSIAKAVVFCLLFLCLNAMPAQAATFDFTVSGLSDYDAVPSGTAYGPSPQFRFTNFFYLTGPGGTLSGTPEFYSDETYAGYQDGWTNLD